jgi:hypothetical protein
VGDLGIPHRSPAVKIQSTTSLGDGAASENRAPLSLMEVDAVVCVEWWWKCRHAGSLGGRGVQRWPDLLACAAIGEAFI